MQGMPQGGLHGLGAPRGARGFLTDEEKQHMPKITKELLLRIAAYLTPYWLLFVLVLVSI